MSATLRAFVVIAAKFLFGDGVRGTVVTALTDAHLVRTLGRDGFAFLGAGLRVRFRATRGVRGRATGATRGKGFLCANLLDRSRRTGRHALLDGIEFTVRVRGQEYAAALVE